MYNDELAHMVRHTHRLKRKADEELKTHEECAKFLHDLSLVHDAMLNLWRTAGQLDIST